MRFVSNDVSNSDDENEINNVTYIEGCINTRKKQIVISTHDRDMEIKNLKLFKNEKQRFIIKLNRRNLNDEIKTLIKEVLKCKYLCLMEGNLHINFGRILVENFQKESYEIIKCDCRIARRAKGNFNKLSRENNKS